MGGAQSKRQLSNAEGEGSNSGTLPLGLGVPGLAAGIGLGIGRSKKGNFPISQAKTSTSEFSILDLANNLTHRFSVLSGLSFISFVSVPPPEVSKKPWSRISRKRWHPSTLQNEYAQCKTAWPVAQAEALFLPEFPVGLQDKLKLILLGEISRGAFGQVFHVKCASTSREYAMKVLSKSQVCSLDAVSQVKQEVMIQHVCSHHTFITPLTHFWQTRKLLIVMTEYVAYGELQQLWRSLGSLPEDLLTLYVAEIAVSIDFLQNAGVIYRDLKMENVLLDSDGHIKLIDFGLAKWLSYGGRTKTICGTLQFMAPEILKGDEYGHSVDWWSLGVIAYSLLTGHYPVAGCNDHMSMSKAVDKFPFEPPENASPPMRSLLQGLLQKVPSVRIHTLHRLQKEESYMNMDLDDVRDKKISPRILLEKYVDGKSRPNFVDFCGLTSTPKKSPSCCTSVSNDPSQGISPIIHNMGQGVLHKACTRRSISSPLLHPGRLGHHDPLQKCGIPPAFSGGAIPILQSPLLRLATGQETPTPRARRAQKAISALSLPTAVSPILVNVRGNRKAKRLGSPMESSKLSRFSRNNNSFKELVPNPQPMQSVSGMNGIYCKSISSECVSSNKELMLGSDTWDSIGIMENSHFYQEENLKKMSSMGGCLQEKNIFRGNFFNKLATSSPQKNLDNVRCTTALESYRMAVEQDQIGKVKLLNGSVVGKGAPLNDKEFIEPFEEFPWISESLET